MRSLKIDVLKGNANAESPKERFDRVQVSIENESICVDVGAWRRLSLHIEGKILDLSTQVKDVISVGGEG